MNYTEQLLQKYPIISDQIKLPALTVVLSQLEAVLQKNVPGDIVEFGCYIGTTSLFIRRLLNSYKSDRAFHVYDSFEGLPAKGGQDVSPAGINFQAGELSASKKQFVHEFHKARLKPPIIHKNWFSQLTEQDVPDTIAFAFLDGDFYDSMVDSLKLAWPRLSPGAVVTIDDYQRETLPGVEKAVHDFFQGKQPQKVVAHNIGIVRATV